MLFQSNRKREAEQSQPKLTGIGESWQLLPPQPRDVGEEEEEKVCLQISLIVQHLADIINKVDLS